MRYMTLTGTSRTAAVWCPGPLANSLWVLDDETRRPLVVKLKYGKVENACESHEWDVSRGTQALTGTVDPDPMWGDQQRGAWKREDSHTFRALVPEGSRAHVARMFFRHAPALREKVWRAAVGDQAQLSMDDAA